MRDREVFRGFVAEKQISAETGPERWGGVKWETERKGG